MASGTQLQGAGTGAASGAAAGSVLGPYGMAAGAILGGVTGYLSQSSDQSDLKKIAKENLIAQQKQQELQRNYANQLLNMSHPAMSAEEIGNLLFKQGSQARQQETDRTLAQVLRANLRSGMSTSNGELIGRANANNAATLGDLRTASTLQGLNAALPSSTAISAAAGLYGGAAPQNTYQPNSTALPQAIGAGMYNLGGILDQYYKSQQAQQNSGQINGVTDQINQMLSQYGYNTGGSYS